MRRSAHFLFTQDPNSSKFSLQVKHWKTFPFIPMLKEGIGRLPSESKAKIPESPSVP